MDAVPSFGLFYGLFVGRDHLQSILSPNIARSLGSCAARIAVPPSSKSRIPGRVVAADAATHAPERFDPELAADILIEFRFQAVA
jgi:hypothetical protein